jgi:hypothetical protein
MDNRVLLGLWRCLVPVPKHVWQSVVHTDARRSSDRLAFMSHDHHRVRDFCVIEIARRGESLSPEAIAHDLGLDLRRVDTILDDLEEHMTFVYRSQGDAVTWAYPVTAVPTPHHLTFSSGEAVYAA